jgi:hypothetical protein
MNFDLWHKIYPFTGLWKTFVSTRIRKFAGYKYPFLHFLWEKKILTAEKFKSWWYNFLFVVLYDYIFNFFVFFLTFLIDRINVSENCKGSAEIFSKNWLGAANHWIEKFWNRYREEAG